jgi:hypothetical protein
MTSAFVINTPERSMASSVARTAAVLASESFDLDLRSPCVWLAGLFIATPG